MQNLRLRPTFNKLVNYLELEQPKIKYPDRTATFLRSSPYLTQFDGPFVNVEELDKQQEMERLHHQVLETLTATMDEGIEKIILRTTQQQKKKEEAIIEKTAADLFSRAIMERAGSQYKKDLEESSAEEVYSTDEEPQREEAASSSRDIRTEEEPQRENEPDEGKGFIGFSPILYNKNEFEKLLKQQQLKYYKYIVSFDTDKTFWEDKKKSRQLNIKDYERQIYLHGLEEGQPPKGTYYKRELLKYIIRLIDKGKWKRIHISKEEYERRKTEMLD